MSLSSRSPWWGGYPKTSGKTAFRIAALIKTTHENNLPINRLRRTQPVQVPQFFQNLLDTHQILFPPLHPLPVQSPIAVRQHNTRHNHLLLRVPPSIPPNHLPLCISQQRKRQMERLLSLQIHPHRIRRNHKQRTLLLSKTAILLRESLQQPPGLTT